MVRRKNPKEIIIAVPTCSVSAVEKVLPFVDKVVCLNLRDTYPYAVADAYLNWYDLSNEDVLRYLSQNPNK
jgi:predicted phosphoribosyltransferase